MLPSTHYLYTILNNYHFWLVESKLNFPLSCVILLDPCLVSTLAPTLIKTFLSPTLHWLIPSFRSNFATRKIFD